MEKNSSERGEGYRADGSGSPMGVKGEREGILCRDSWGGVNVKSVKFSSVSVVCSLESHGGEGWGIGTSGAAFTLKCPGSSAGG